MNPSLVLIQPRKTCPFITERLLMGRKESNQTNKTINFGWSIKFIKGSQVTLVWCFMSQSTAMVMSGRSVHLTILFPGQA